MSRSVVPSQPLAFDAWLEASDARSIAKALARYGQHLCDSGAALYKLRQAILAVQGLRRDLRGALTTAWDSVRVWEGLIPLHDNCPWLLPLWRAVLSLLPSCGDGGTSHSSCSCAFSRFCGLPKRLPFQCRTSFPPRYMSILSSWCG